MPIPIGFTHSEETKAKISSSMKGRKRAPKAEAEVKEPYPPQAPGRPFDQRNQREL